MARINLVPLFFALTSVPSAFGTETPTAPACRGGMLDPVLANTVRSALTASYAGSPEAKLHRERETELRELFSIAYQMARALNAARAAVPPADRALFQALPVDHPARRDALERINAVVEAASRAYRAVDCPAAPERALLVTHFSIGMGGPFSTACNLPESRSTHTWPAQVRTLRVIGDRIVACHRRFIDLHELPERMPEPRNGRPTVGEAGPWGERIVSVSEEFYPELELRPQVLGRNLLPARHGQVVAERRVCFSLPISAEGGSAPATAEAIIAATAPPPARSADEFVDGSLRNLGCRDLASAPPPAATNWAGSRPDTAPSVPAGGRRSPANAGAAR